MQSDEFDETDVFTRLSQGQSNTPSNAYRQQSSGVTGPTFALNGPEDSNWSKIRTIENAHNHYVCAMATLGN